MLELSAADNIVARENIEVLRRNGFDVTVEEAFSHDEDEEDDALFSINGTLKLTAKPVSKSTVFGMKGQYQSFLHPPCRSNPNRMSADLEEIIGLLRDQPTGQMVRCSKARAMFASRACRKSVMIGMPLNKNQMTTVRV